MRAEIIVEAKTGMFGAVVAIVKESMMKAFEGFLHLPCMPGFASDLPPMRYVVGDED
jgi:hypothetical protein